jgi:hypothetical protein
MKKFRFKEWFFVLVYACYLVSCTSDKPKSILSESEMIKIISEIHLAESKVANAYMSVDSSRMFYTALEKEIFDKHKITTQDFKTNYDFYLNNPILMDKIYAAVVDTLSIKEGLGKLN